MHYFLFDSRVRLGPFGMINTIVAPPNRHFLEVIAPENFGQVPEEIDHIDNIGTLKIIILDDN